MLTQSTVVNTMFESFVEHLYVLLHASTRTLSDMTTIEVCLESTQK